MPKMHLRQPGFTYSACGSLIKNKERMQEIKRQEIQGIFIKTNCIKLASNLARLMTILKIYLADQLLIKHCVIKHLILLEVQYMIDFKDVLLQCFISFLIKCFLAVLFHGHGQRT